MRSYEVEIEVLATFHFSRPVSTLFPVVTPNSGQILRKLLGQLPLDAEIPLVRIGLRKIWVHEPLLAPGLMHSLLDPSQLENISLGQGQGGLGKWRDLDAQLPDLLAPFEWRIPAKELDRRLGRSSWSAKHQFMGGP
jgi:hypothetical protein